MITSKRSLLLPFFLYFLFTSPVHARDHSEALLELFQRIDGLNKEIRTLRGENEQLQHTVENLKKAQKNGFLGVDGRVDGLEKKINGLAKKQASTPATKVAEKKSVKTVTPTNKPTVKPTPPKTTATIKPAPTPAKKITAEKPKAKLTGTAEVVKTPKHKIRPANKKEKSAYNEAYATVKGNPASAIQAFRGYIIKYPESPLAANAQYWVGEIMYSQKNYKGAVDEFVKVLQNYRKSEKASDAAIKLGFSFYELKNWVYARRALEDVNRYFPNTKAATLARQRIAKMKSDGKY
ncbi:MAG: tol-pal system protein YbgF [Cocleimonas sp.]|nr:tol-pal system protein YbgF [Cocleimonas sp.]